MQTDRMEKQLPKAFVRLWLFALMLVAAFIRVHGAGDYYYNADEAMHTGIASGTTLAQVLQYSHYEIHPPVLYILCHYWMGFSGDPAFVRGLPLIFGLATIPLYYFIGKLLGGEFCGLCCAALIAFSNGCIIQSYVVRHYMIFLFFMSLAFYYYLLWREDRRQGRLLGYTVFAIISCLTHFSAIFCVFCIGGYEALRLWRRKEPAALPHWVLANAVVGAIALYSYHLWQPIMAPLQSYFATHTAGSLPLRLAHALFYPLATPGYILPDYTAALILLVLQCWVLIAPPRFISNPVGLRAALALNALAYVLGMLLVITRIYPEPGTRHSMWVLPFVIPTAGWILADLCGWLKTRLPEKLPSLPLMAAAILILGVLTYSPERRFRDSSEYIWPQAQWQSLTAYLQTLRPTDLIVTEKDDGIMLANLYPFMGSDAFTGDKMAALAPYANTHILFNPYYPRNYSWSVMLVTLKEAEAHHMLDGADRLVFLRMAWSRSPLTDLMLCDALTKQLVAFPPFTSREAITRDVVTHRYAVAMLVAKQDFLAAVLAPAGKARGCLNGEHDMVPGFAAGAAQ